MRRTITALLLLVSGVAAAVTQPAKQTPIAQTPRTGHCDIGVVSRLGGQFNVRNKDLGSFVGNARVPVESWHIDDLVADRIRGALGKRAAVQRIPYRKEAFSSFRKPNLFRLFRNDDTRTLATGTRCARYVLVTAGSEYMVDENDLVGLGIYISTSSLFRHTIAFVHAVIRLSVYDGETFALLRSTVNSPSHRNVDESFWPDPPNSAAQNAKLREATRELVARTLDATLPKLSLAP